MDHIRWLAEPELHSPVLVAAFTGWNDAGDAASTAVRTLIEAWGATPLANIDPEIFTDFATVRPHVRLDAEGQRHIVWPTVAAWSARLASTDIILLLGPEPALRWRQFTEQVIRIAQRFDTSIALTLGALLADVPHSRPVQLIGTSLDVALIERFDLQRSRYEGPTGIIGVLHDALTHAGIAGASLWAAVPGYASQLPSPKAAMALVERACGIIGCSAPLSSLASSLGEYDARVAALLAADDDLAGYVEQLERHFDVGGFDDEDDEDDSFDDFDQDTADEVGDDVDPGALVEEVEQYLRNRDDGI
jgi:proteasome assembly chaperone (PAC2) family protein